MDSKTTVGIAAIMGALVAFVVGPMIHSPLIVIEVTVAERPDALSRDAVFQAAATIMALTVFGSLFGVSIKRRAKTVRSVTKVALLIAVMVVVTAQVYVMNNLFYTKIGFHPLFWLAPTGFALVVIVGCLAILGWGRDRSTSSEQTEQS